MKVFVDSNIPMYVAGRDHPHREPARRLLERVRVGELEACASTEVLQEILYRYHALKRLDLARQVYELFVLLCPVILPVTLAAADRARQLVCSGAGVGVRDAIHAAVMLNNDIRDIASFDAGFDVVPEIRRLPLVSDPIIPIGPTREVSWSCEAGSLSRRRIGVRPGDHRRTEPGREARRRFPSCTARRRQKARAGSGALLSTIP